MSEFRTRVIQVAHPLARATAENGPTIFNASWLSGPRTDFHALFLTHYARIRETCLEFAQPGLAVFVLHPQRGWEATLCLTSRAGELRAGVLGRHSEAELFVGDDPGLALRHLLFVVEPPRSLRDAVRGAVRFRVLDLHTGSPPTDEEGRAVVSLTAEGPVFLTCQGHAILALVTGDPTAWPASATDAWANLPWRVFVEERLAPTATGSAPSPLPGGPGSRALSDLGRITIVRRHDGPIHVAARLAGEDQPVHGQLVIRSGDRLETLLVSRESLRRGLLIGRYERCEANGDNAIEDDHVSRVHLLVVELVGQPFAIDLASTNGTFRAFPASGAFVRFRTALLEEGLILALGDQGTFVRWVTAGTPRAFGADAC